MDTDTAPAAPASADAPDPQKTFRFYDNRQKYLMFVNTCSEKRVVADRISRELAHIRPTPPALRVFDAGIGDGTVLERVMRAMHARFETIPFYVVGKEISLEDVRLALEKVPDRLQEHPATVVVLTNLHYSEAPYLQPRNPDVAARVVWREVPLVGRSSADYERQIAELEPFLATYWKARTSPTSGNPVYEQPTVLVLYLESHRFLLHDVIPKRGTVTADYDLVIASQPYRAKAPTTFKAQRVVMPLARGLARGGRLIGIHSSGGDPAMEIVQGVWPDEEPFTDSRHDILRETEAALGTRSQSYTFDALPDAESLFRYDMYTLPDEIDSQAVTIGTSTLLAAWNNATYVAQIEDDRLSEAMSSRRYLDVTRDVLRKHDGLWFNDESYVITRKRDV